jgi:hypothetical protein
MRKVFDLVLLMVVDLAAPAPPPDVVDPWRKLFDLLLLTSALSALLPPVCLVS